MHKTGGLFRGDVRRYHDTFQSWSCLQFPGEGENTQNFCFDSLVITQKSQDQLTF
jgi:hypothetical protein